MAGMSLRQVRTFGTVHRESFGTLCFTPDGKYLFSGGQEWSDEEDDMVGRAVMTSLTGQQVAALSDPEAIAQGSVAPSGNVAAVSMFDGIMLVRTPDLSTVAHLSLDGMKAFPLRFTPDGRYLAACSRSPKDDDLDVLWLYRTLDWKAEAISDQLPPAITLVASSQGRVAVGDVRANVQVWDVHARRQLFVGVVPPQGGRWRTVLAFCAAGAQLLTGADIPHSLHLWDIASGQCISRIEYEPTVSALLPYDEASLVFVGDEDGMIALWDVHRRQILARAESGPGKLPGIDEHTDEQGTAPVEPAAVACLAVSPDRRLLAAGDVAGSIHLYEIHGLA